MPNWDQNVSHSFLQNIASSIFRIFSLHTLSLSFLRNSSRSLPLHDKTILFLLHQNFPSFRSLTHTKWPLLSQLKEPATNLIWTFFKNNFSPCSSRCHSGLARLSLLAGVSGHAMHQLRHMLPFPTKPVFHPLFDLSGKNTTCKCSQKIP